MRDVFTFQLNSLFLITLIAPSRTILKLDGITTYWRNIRTIILPLLRICGHKKCIATVKVNTQLMCQNFTEAVELLDKTKKSYGAIFINLFLVCVSIFVFI